MISASFTHDILSDFNSVCNYMKWLYYQKYIKPGNFESSNSKTKPYQYLKTSFKICWFVNCSLTKKLIFFLFLRNLEDSFDFSNFFVSGYLHQFKTILLHIFMISRLNEGGTSVYM